jgi:hypothetical protein
MKSETREHATDETLPRFVPPPPRGPKHGLAPKDAQLWLRLLGLVAAGWVVALLARRIMHAEPATQLLRLAKAFGDMPALEWLPAVLVVLAAMASAAVGLREPRRKARTLLPLIGVVALPLLLGTLLGAWG